MAVFSAYKRPASSAYEMVITSSLECCVSFRRCLSEAATDGPEQQRVPCPVCDSLSVITHDGSAEQAQRVGAAIMRAALESGKCCAHVEGEIVEGEVVVNGAPCPCGMRRIIFATENSNAEV